MSDLKGCFSHNSDNWRTPKYIYDYYVTKEGYVDLFPYCSDVDQYGIDYDNQRLFCNPPFSQLDKVSDYLIKQLHNGCDIMLLCPARTDTKWFHKLLKERPIIYFIKGRLHFNESKGSAPFPTIMMYFSEHNIMPTWCPFLLVDKYDKQ